MNKLTVTEITQQIKFLLESNFSSHICVVGEISNLSFSPTGHIYFTLKDDSAQIKVVFFKRYNLANNYKLKQGDKVEVIGNLSVYENDGVYQIIARKVVYDSAGDFYKKFEETKRVLEKEGLFDKDKKKPIPKIIKNVAVLTSPGGAAIRDFLQTLRNNYVGLSVDIWPVQVQGSQAIRDIILSLRALNRYCDNYDVAILMRGGGSLEDLIIFNEEALAREFFSLKIPTISAIGHERDFSICDFVADLRVSTPTAAAETLSRPYIDLRREVSENIKNLKRSIENKIDKHYQLFDKFLSLISFKNPSNIIKFKKNMLHKYISNIISSINIKVMDNSMLNNDLMYRILTKNPEVKIGEYKNYLNLLQVNINGNILRKLEANKYRHSFLMEKMKLLNPENILERGYAIVYKGKLPVGSASDINLEDSLEIHFKDGYTNAFVTGKKMKKI